MEEESIVTRVTQSENSDDNTHWNMLNVERFLYSGSICTRS